MGVSGTRVCLCEANVDSHSTANKCALFSWQCSTTVLKRYSGPRCSCYTNLLLLSVGSGSCVFTLVLMDVSPNIFFGGEEANCSSYRYPNYVVELCTASREQLSL